MFGTEELCDIAHLINVRSIKMKSGSALNAASCYALIYQLHLPNPLHGSESSLFMHIRKMLAENPLFHRRGN